MSKFTEREVLGKISEKFAASDLLSIDMIFDMLIEPGSLDFTRVTKKRFREYVLDITPTLREQDVDILLKTHPLLAGKDYIDLSDFKALFEIPVQNARNKLAEDMAERDKNYTQAQKYFKQTAPGGLAASAIGVGGGFNGASMTFTQNPFMD